MKKFLFIIGIILLLTIEILSIYYIMPFPGSQQETNVGLAYFINQWIWIWRFIGFILLIPFFTKQFRQSRWYTKTFYVLFILIWGVVFYMTSFVIRADKLFLPMEKVVMASVADNKVDLQQIVIGIELNGQAAAYPVEIIGYHHQVSQEIKGKKVWVTYCTVCHSGRVFDPTFEGKSLEFTLVGMDNFNAMFSDDQTGSWWQQATGECVAGKSQGEKLKEIPSFQMTLEEWIKQYPQTKILQPDPLFEKEYNDLKRYDEGTMESSLEGRDQISGSKKSWVIGIVTTKGKEMVDWNELVKQKMVKGKNLIVVLTDGKFSFRAFDPAGRNLEFDSENKLLFETDNDNLWDMKGHCIKGKDAGKTLNALPAYQEFLHSWQTFNGK